MEKVTWFNIPADDLDGLSTFYTKVFGWDIKPTTKASQEALDFKTALTAKSNETYRSQEAGVINGCFVRRDLGLLHPTILVRVDNLTQKIKEVEAAGGRVIRQQTELPEANGRFAFVTDPEGNTIELWEPLH
jgi:predicted enzyme related to lactoylglutathione lyase